jgi:hypothetical protein
MMFSKNKLILKKMSRISAPFGTDGPCPPDQGGADDRSVVWWMIPLVLVNVCYASSL